MAASPSLGASQPSLGRWRGPASPLAAGGSSSLAQAAASSAPAATFRCSLQETRETLRKLSAKARKGSCHPGPLELRPALPGRDCTSWVRQDKKYNPYSYFESPDKKATPLPKKSPGPPPLWLLPRAKEAKGKKGAKKAKPQEGGTEPEDGPGKGPAEAKRKSPLEERWPWDAEHHITYSRMNDQVQVGMREYFDKPMRKEGEGVPKVRQQYCMNDRQCCFNDEPGPLGDYRRTVLDTLGPAKEQQLPSFWRTIKDWRSYKTPENGLSLTAAAKPRATPAAQKSPEPPQRALLLALADLPASGSKDFWRGWAEAQASPGSLPGPPAHEVPSGWDDRWNVCWSRANDIINPRQREYFSVPEGSTGLATAPARRRKGRKDGPGGPSSSPEGT